jgi:hypothetical protein
MLMHQRPFPPCQYHKVADAADCDGTCMSTQQDQGARCLPSGTHRPQFASEYLLLAQPFRSAAVLAKMVKIRSTSSNQVASHSAIAESHEQSIISLLDGPCLTLRPTFSFTSNHAPLFRNSETRRQPTPLATSGVEMPKKTGSVCSNDGIDKQ